MSVSETLDPVPPSTQLTEPKFEPIDELPGPEGSLIAPMTTSQSEHLTPPAVPSSDSVADLGAQTPGHKAEDFPGSDQSGVALKSESSLLSPHVASDLGSAGNSAFDAKQMFNLHPSPPENSQQHDVGYASGMVPRGGVPAAINTDSSDGSGPRFRPPFVVNLDMVKRTMEGVNRILGVDLSDTEVSESALLDDPNKDTLNEDARGNAMGMDQKDSVVVAAKGEYSHMRLICDACGYIVAAVGRAVLEAARESFEEGVKQGTPGMAPKPPVRKKRGGILGFKELAARANLSPWHFHRVFRVTTGVTPKTYGEALWEYLMIESGFNLDNEELTIDRNLNSKPGTALAQGVSPSSSSSPQSPIMASHYSPNSSSRSPPITSAVMGTSGAPQTASHTQALAQNGAAPGDGRVRKSRSRSRPSRSRSRTRSQTQSQVLTTLSAIGDAAADPGPRGRSFSRGVHTPVSAGPVPQQMLANAGVSGSQGHPAAMPPPPAPQSQQQMGADPLGSTTFDTDWFGPPEDLLSGLGGPSGSAQGNNPNAGHLSGQDIDVPDLTALSLQQLGLDTPAGAGDMTGMNQRNDNTNWQMPNTMNPMGSPQVMASSAPDLSILGSTYGNPISRVERFKSPESIANGERNQQMNAQFGMHNFQAPPQQGMYDDGAAMNSYVGSLNMNSFHRDADFSVPRGMHMQQQLGMNQGSTVYPSHTMSPTGMNSFQDDTGSIAGSQRVDTQMPNVSNATPMHNMHENLRPGYRGSMRETTQENYEESLQPEMFQQQQQGDGLGGLGDLPASYYLGSKNSPKYEGSSEQEDDDFVSALIGDDPPMLSSWNEANEGQAHDYGF